MAEVDVLDRAYRLFAGAVRSSAVGTAPDLAFTSAGNERHREALDRSLRALQAAGKTDAALAAVLAAAARDHTVARALTRAVLEEARADAGAPADSPVAQREAVRRMVARLRAQHDHVSTARRRAARRLAILRALRYRALLRRSRFRLAPPHSRAGLAVRAALSRLGRPYVWGATGPDQFDCSGLVQWAYRQAGVSLDRTTYDQINDGTAVPRSQVRPGDLVFPHAGHVQLAIGNGMVVEAPHAGATVRISPLGHDVVIRRPLR